MSKWPKISLARLITDERSGASLNQDEFTDSGVPVVPKKAISESVDLGVETLVYTSKDKYLACKNAQVTNDFLITTLRNLNPDGSTLGLICRNDLQGDFMLAQGMHAFKVNRELISPDYLCYASRSLEFRKEVQKIKVGSTQVHIRARELKEIQIPLPPLEEQKRIAAILDKADSLRRKRAQAIALADDFLRATFLDLFGDPVTNPKGWQAARLEDVALQITDGEHQTPQRSAEGVYLLSARNIQNGYLALSDVDYVSDAEYQRIRKRCEPVSGDILISCSGSIGRVAQVETNVPLTLVRSVALVRPNKTLIRSGFLEWLLRSEALQRQMQKASKSSAQANLFQAPIRALSIYIPPLKIQDQFENIRLHALNVSNKFKKADLRLELLKKSIQYKYL